MTYYCTYTHTYIPCQSTLLSYAFTLSFQSDQFDSCCCSDGRYSQINLWEMLPSWQSKPNINPCDFRLISVVVITASNLGSYACFLCYYRYAVQSISWLIHNVTKFGCFIWSHLTFLQVPVLIWLSYKSWLNYTWFFG